MKRPVPALIHSFLLHLGIKIDENRIRAVSDRHPLSHSIRSLSDTLDELAVPNAVYRLSFEQLFEIEGAFIVVAGADEYPFHIVAYLDKERQTIVLRTVYGRKIELTFGQFISAWDGTVLMAEKGEATKEDAWWLYYIKQGLSFVDRTTNYWLAVLAATLLFLGALWTPEWADLRYLIKAAGVAVSLLVIIKSSFAPHLAQRFCRYGEHADCNDVFRSAGAKFLNWASLGELSLTYFASSILWGIFLSKNPAGVFIVLDTFALLFVAYSLIWQAYKNKRCSLCLLIDLILVIDFCAELLLWGEFGRFHWLWPVGFGLLFALILLVVRNIVGMREANQSIPRLRFKNERLLSAPELFWHLLYKQPEETVDSNDIPAICNFVEAEHTITVVMNPSCPKCAKAHDAISSIDGCRINLVFVVNEDDEHSYNVARTIISASVQSEWDVVDKIIRMWYTAQQLPRGFGIHPCAKNDLEEQIQYCKKIRVEGTPTVLIDNRRLPDIYDIEDLKILL